MRNWGLGRAVGTGLAVLVAAMIAPSSPVRADGNLQNVNHIIIAMQENHSFDNYFGALAYVKHSPYHSAKVPTGGGPPVCRPTDHRCVDGLTCQKKHGVLGCSNSNLDHLGNTIFAFHDSNNYCVGPDLDHSWDGSHQESNYSNPDNTLVSSPNDGFVRVNYATEQHNESDDTIGYYTNDDLPFYYALAETFAISDSYHAALIDQTFPNRAYMLAGTSFGHLTTNEITLGPPYLPITMSIFDLLDENGITWTNYYSDPVRYSLMFSPASSHQQPVSQFAIDAQNGTLPQVAFIDAAAFGTAADYTYDGHRFEDDHDGTGYETDEHPPADIRAGQLYMWQYVVDPLYHSPSWEDSLLIITYDEHGGYYDHVAPPAALMGMTNPLNPDGIDPGQCEDLSNPPTSETPGNGRNCHHSATVDAPGICATFTPHGPYPASCPNFNQMGFRVPFIAVSPFAKRKYVSHTLGDHTSLLALVENRFLNNNNVVARLTDRDANANDLEDLFDFDHSPSLRALLPGAPEGPANDHGCPF